jgi:hypothetical protein
VKSGLGVPGETTIHLGYTRSICISSKAPTLTIQDYLVSSNFNIISVNKYGTVKTLSNKEAYVYIYNKYNNKVRGYILFIVI